MTELFLRKLIENGPVAILAVGFAFIMFRLATKTLAEIDRKLDILLSRREK